MRQTQDTFVACSKSRLMSSSICCFMSGQSSEVHFREIRAVELFVIGLLHPQEIHFLERGAEGLGGRFQLVVLRIAFAEHIQAHQAYPLRRFRKCIPCSQLLYSVLLRSISMLLKNASIRSWLMFIFPYGYLPKLCRMGFRLIPRSMAA